MNVAEKRRAEGLVRDWKARRKSEIKADQVEAVEAIKEPPAVVRSRGRITQEIERLITLGYDFKYRPYGACGPDGAVKISRSATHPEVISVKDVGDLAQSGTETEARQLIARIWSDVIEFSELMKRIA